MEVDGYFGKMTLLRKAKVDLEVRLHKRDGSPSS